jgi:DNA-binding winged helix-turn-helix (wHTH) protein/tetratricopeptide (TPR) repeat protein
VHGRGEPLLTKAELADRPDFMLGSAVLRPSSRTVTGPGGSAQVEPRVMQVLLALADAAGAVVTRDTLFARCWGKVYVGEDSLNRAIYGVRRIASGIAAGSFEVETVQGTGYRLVGTVSALSEAQPHVAGANKGPTRRRLIGAGLAAAVGGFGLWSAPRPERDSSTQQLIERGQRVLYSDLPDGGETAARMLREAVQRDPQNAQALGLLAFAYRDIAESAPPTKVSAAIEASQEAARRALAIDPRDGGALAALAMIRPYFGEWAAAEDRLRNVLRVAPDNILALNSLVPLMQGVGRLRTSYALNERVLELDPVSPVASYRRGIKLWQFGRLDEADQAIDRAMQLWPRFPAVWNARMMIFAYTGRADAGLSFLGEVASRPESLSETAVNLWRVSLKALASRGSVNVAAAREANIALAPRSPGFANNAIMTLSVLGELDAAFDVAFGTFLRRGRLIGTLWGGAGEMPVNTLRWRRTVALFIPATAALRADPRFLELCRGMGLSRYWRERPPDYRDLGFRV